MQTNEPLPGPCNLCRDTDDARVSEAWICRVCGWRHGDVPDGDLPLPQIDVVYYIRYDRRVKIGTNRRPRQRLASIRHEELLAFERGGRTLEHQRHREYAPCREGGEWFAFTDFTDELRAHTRRLRSVDHPWELCARWLSQALHG